MRTDDPGDDVINPSLLDPVLIGGVERRVLGLELFFVVAFISVKGLTLVTVLLTVLIVGPPRPRPNWQTRTPGAFLTEDFFVDWQNQKVICPQGKASVSWLECQRPNGEPFIKVRFQVAECRACPVRERCTRSPTVRARQLVLKPRG